LDEFFGHAFVAGLGFPEVEDFCQPADHGVVGVFVLSFETEKFTEFFDGGLHWLILSWGRVKIRMKAKGRKMKVENREQIAAPNHSWAILLSATGQNVPAKLN
jgi:hypothetical protein